MNSIQPQWRRRAQRVSCVIIGAGHNGLAMSYALSQHGIDHVVLERGEVANSWQHERWDSLRLLTPNSQSRLPGYRYEGSNPNGYKNKGETVAFIHRYAQRIAAPVCTGTTVTGVFPRAKGYLVMTDRDEWHCRQLVIASGAFSQPVLPLCHQEIPKAITQITSNYYRNPAQLPDGGVLVVGASATGLQLAQEIHNSGRPVTLAVGEHVRMPRSYRNRDILWWMETVGLLDESYREVDDLRRARRVPSPQLVGTPEHTTLDLNALSAQGVKLVGRLSGLQNQSALFSGSLNNVCKLADLKMQRLLDHIDEWVLQHGWDTTVGHPQRYANTRVDSAPTLSLDLGSGEIQTVVWATGYRPDYSWLKLPVFDRKGNLKHNGGIVAAPGMVVLGLPFMRRRKSSYMHGAEDDVRDMCDYLVAGLRARHSIGVSPVQRRNAREKALT